jgi:DNA-binding MarR family transcriptional regulator
MDKSLNYMPRPLLLSRTTEDSIVLTLFDIANELGKLGEGVSSRAGLTTQQWLMLLQIAGDPNFAAPKDGPARHGPGVMASDIARARGVSRANVSILVAQLLKMGLVGQEEQPGDRRRKHLTVTHAGRSALADIESARHEANQNLFAGLTPAERRQLLRSLHACLERLWLVDRSGGVGRAPAQTARRKGAGTRRVRRVAAASASVPGG